MIKIVTKEMNTSKVQQHVLHKIIPTMVVINAAKTISLNHSPPLIATLHNIQSTIILGVVMPALIIIAPTTITNSPRQIATQ